MRRLFAVLSSVALVVGLTTLAASPASAAATPAIVTVGDSAGSSTLSAAMVIGQIGDTFVIVDGTSGGTNGFFIRNSSGSVSKPPGISCATGISCIVDNGLSLTLTINGYGSLDVKANGKFTTTLTISSGGSSVAPASVTLSFDANGGSCSANPMTKTGFAGATYVLPTAVECTRANYSLAGWAFSRDASEPATPNTGAGATVNFVVSETMYAVWTPDGVEVTYDANIAVANQCLSKGTNLATAASRKSTPVVRASPIILATSAPCNPANTDLKLVGWATSGNGDSIGGVNTAGEPVIPRGTKVTLYAIWQVVISCAKGGGAAGTCVVGDTGPVGGRVFYVKETNATGSSYMEAAPNTWNGGAVDPLIAWCSKTKKTVLGTFRTAIGTGKANTDLMVAGGACNSGAANRVRAYTGGGVSWFLPSKDELDVLNSQRTVVGGFAADYYWSSSQFGARNAWSQSFLNGLSSLDSKVFTLRVRPVRDF